MNDYYRIGCRVGAEDVASDSKFKMGPKTTALVAVGSIVGTVLIMGKVLPRLKV